MVQHCASDRESPNPSVPSVVFGTTAQDEQLIRIRYQFLNLNLLSLYILSWGKKKSVERGGRSKLLRLRLAFNSDGMKIVAVIL
jgi:hypothetical protein